MATFKRTISLPAVIALFLLGTACGGDAAGSVDGQPRLDASAETTTTLRGSDSTSAPSSTTTGDAPVGPNDEPAAASATSSPAPTATPGPLDAPRISSLGGVFGSPQTVTIQSGETDASVLYTLDGTSPSPQNGTIYTAPLKLTESAQLRAVTYRPCQPVSEVAEADFQFFGHLLEKTGDITLSGNDEMVIEDTLFLHEGNITLTDNARLVIRNSFVTHVKDFGFQYGVSASGNSSITLENSSIGSNCTGSFNYSFTDSAALHADHVDVGTGNCNTWFFMGGDSKIDIANWDYFGGTVCNDLAVAISDSEKMEVELCLPGGATVDMTLPTTVDRYSYGPYPAKGVDFSLEMTNSTVEGWGINVLPGAHITIRDADAITIGVIVGLPWQDVTAKLDGLETGYYSFNRWNIGPDATLTLINTSVYGWEPNVFADNTLIIRNSNYTASTVNSGDGLYEISDSTVNILSAAERVTMTVTNTVITGDVIANDDSVIILIDCEVRGADFGDGLTGGNVFARGNGKVILRNTSVGGRTETQDDATITSE